MGGSIGAIIGIFIGNFFDKGLMTHFSKPYWQYHTARQEGVQKVFFNAVFSVMGHVAKANGHVSQQHIQMALDLMDEMSLNKYQKDLAKQCFNEGKQASFDLPATLFTLRTICRNNMELLKIFMDIQYKAAQVGGLSTKKVQLLDSIFKQLGFIPLHQQNRYYEDLNQRWSSSSSSRQEQSSQYQGRGSSSDYSYGGHDKLREAFTLLEISPNASKQDIKRAYRRMVSKNHPDKLIAQGLPEELIKIANAKTQRITKAYEYICESKGW